MLTKLNTTGSDTSSSQLNLLAHNTEDKDLQGELKVAAMALEKYEKAIARSAVDSLHFKTDVDRAVAEIKVSDVGIVQR